MAPNAAASGKITRHRLNRGGDYQSNLAQAKDQHRLKRYIALGAGLTVSAPKTSVGDRQVDGERSAN